MRRLMIIAVAIGAAVLPLSPAFIETYYARTVYPPLQRVLTTFSNGARVALFDALLLAGGVLLVLFLVRRGRVLNVLCLLAVTWLLFLTTWGLNYRRVPLATRLEYSEERLTTENAVAIAQTAVREMNRLHQGAHAEPLPDVDSLAGSLAPAMTSAASDLSLPAPVPARPKDTWLAPYFRIAGIDGMTDPFFLETLLAPDLLPFERPAALAHEWGHLAGLANEAEASFFGWLTCLRGDSRAQYSGWVALYPHLLGALPAEARKEVHSQLGTGPREDFTRIRERLARANEALRAAAATTYDKFLRVNRVDEGIQSYDAVVRLVVGTSYDERFVPRRRSSN